MPRDSLRGTCRPQRFCLIKQAQSTSPISTHAMAAPWERDVERFHLTTQTTCVFLIWGGPGDFLDK